MAGAPDISNAGIPQDEVRLVVSWYKEFAARARAEIFNPPGTTQNSRDARMAMAASRINQLQKLAGQLDQKAASWVGRRMPTVVQQGRVTADRQALEVGVHANVKVGTAFNLVDSQALHVVARDTLADLRKASGGVLKTAARVLRATADNGLTQGEINDVIKGRLIEGRRDEAIRQLRGDLERVNKGNIVQITTRTGGTMHLDAGDYASTIVRTKTREAVVQARIERFTELDLDLVSITGRLSANFCSAFLNQVFSISGKSSKYPALNSLPGGGPPFHPNCSKSVRPFVESLASAAQIKAAEPAADVGKLLGTDPTRAQRLYKDLQLHAQTKARVSPIVRFAS